MEFEPIIEPRRFQNIELLPLDYYEDLDMFVYNSIWKLHIIEKKLLYKNSCDATKVRGYYGFLFRLEILILTIYRMPHIRYS